MQVGGDKYGSHDYVWLWASNGFESFLRFRILWQWAQIDPHVMNTDVSRCYDTPQILISDFTNFRENQQ